MNDNLPWATFWPSLAFAFGILVICSFAKDVLDDWICWKREEKEKDDEQD